MKAILCTGIMCFILVFVVSAQQADQITVKKEGLKKIYLLGEEPVDSKQLSSLLGSNPNSMAAYKVSKTHGIIGLSSMACGTVFIGVGFYYTIKSAQASGNDDLAGTTEYSNKSGNNMLIGAGLYVLSVPFFLLSNSNLKKSINLYNASTSTGSINSLDLYVGFTGEGIGVGLKF